MKILSYKAGGPPDYGMQFPQMDFGKLNLVVGNSGAGKTRLLNTIFNGARMVVQKEQLIYTGFWEMTIEHNSDTYRWIIETSKNEDDNENQVISEQVIKCIGVEESLIVDRALNYFKFKDKDLPKLPQDKSAITLLKNEDAINPIYEALKLIMRRNFSGAELEKACAYENLQHDLFNKIKSRRDIRDLFHSGFNLSCKLYVLSQVFKERFDSVCNEFKSIFPFVSEVGLRKSDEFGVHYPGIIPVFALKEKFSDRWLPLNQFSSGMLKVLLILSDIHILPDDGCVYLIDEFENSLGINAIHFFPPLHYEGAANSQFIITSHHPYIIGHIPVKDWLVLHRKGNYVEIQQGRELEAKYGKSKQEAFIQLINDPFYVEGIK